MIVHLSPYAIPPLATALCFLFFSAYVLLKHRASARAFSYVLWCLTTVYWQLSWAILLSIQDPDSAFTVARIGYTGIIFIPITFYHFTLRFLNISSLDKWLAFNYGIGLLFVSLLWSGHEFIRGVYRYSWGFYPKAGYQHALYLVFLVYLIWRFIPLIHREKARVDLSDIRRKQVTYTYWALIIYILAAGDFLVNYGIGFYPIGFIFTLICLALVSYAMVKHQLLDIQIVIRKTLVYSVVSAVLVAIYVGIITISTRVLEGYFLHASVFSSATAAGIIAILFHPFQTYLQHWIDRKFPRESLDQALLREATSDFVHEIKRPLANISMPAQLALQDLKLFGDHHAVPQLRRRLEYILHESLEAGEMIEAIRSLSSRTPAEQKPVDLGKLLAEALSREQSRIAEGKIEVSVAFGTPAPIVLGNAKQLQIAMGNILKNAIDALIATNGSNPRRLRLSAVSNSDNVTVQCADSGPGIPAGDLSRLFTPWFSTKGSSGMGIGLFLSREVLRAHDASIDVESREGEGTRFVLTFHRETQC